MKQYMAFLDRGTTGYDDETPLMRVKDAEGETDDTKDRTNQQLLELQKQNLAKQDRQLDEVIGITQAIKGEAQNFNDEVTLQNKMLDKLDGDLDQTNKKMVRVDNNMKRLIKKTNQKAQYGMLCTLVCVLVIEILVKTL